MRTPRAAKQTPALLRPPAVAVSGGGPALLRATPTPVGGNGAVGIFKNSAAVADQLIGAITSLPENDEVLQRAGITRYQLRELEFDDEISGALDTRRDAVVSTPWHLDPADNERSAFITEQLFKHAADILRGAWAAVPYGYSVMEAVYEKLPDGRIGIASIGERPMEWFALYRDGRVTMRLAQTGEEVECDQRFKFFVTKRNPTWRNPAGDALLSRLYWAWHFRHNAWRYWITFLERFGTPIFLGKGHAPQELADALVSMGATLAMSVGVDEDVSAVTQGAAGEFSRAEDALCRRIQKLILGQTLTTDVGNSGSYAAAKVHDAVRQDRKHADIRLIAPTMQNIVNALWWLNRFPGNPPEWSQGDGAGLQPDRAARDSTLANAGILKFTEDYLLRAYDFEPGDIEMPPPPPDLDDPDADPEDEDDPEGAPPNTPSDPPEDQPDTTRAPARRRVRQSATAPMQLASARYTRRQQEVERLGDASLAQARASGAIDERAVRAAIQAARDPADLAERLSLLVPDLPGGVFDALLARALFAADVLGYAQERIGGPVLDDLNRPGGAP